MMKQDQADEEHCPHCGGSLVGDPIPEEQRDMYPSGATHYLKTIGVEVPGVYDGVLFWTCPACNGSWHRWPEGHHLRARAAEYVDNES